MNNSLNEANKESKGIGCPGWCVSVHFDDLKTTAKGQLLLLMLFPFNKNRKKKSPNKTSMKSSQTNGPFTNDRQSQKVEEEEEAETCHKYLLCLSMSLANHTKEDRINQEKQRNKNKNCFPFNIFLFFFSFFFFLSVFFMQDVEPVVPFLVSARLLFHRRLDDIRSPNKKWRAPILIQLSVCVSYRSNGDDKKEKKREREIKDSPFLLFTVDDEHNSRHKKRGILAIHLGTKWQATMPDTDDNI